jgi:hypothetical protein
MRPKKISERIKSLINEEVYKFLNDLNEMFNSDIETECEVLKKNISGVKAVVYRFKTNSGTKYDLEFIITSTPADTVLDDGTLICDILKNSDCEEIYWSIDIGFTLTERLKNKNDITDDAYVENTNKNETIELMGRITNLIKKFVESTPKINIYCVGRDTHNTKLKMYKNMYINIFTNYFKMFEGESSGYDDGAFYFIKHSILK